MNEVRYYTLSGTSYNLITSYVITDSNIIRGFRNYLGKVLPEFITDMVEFSDVYSGLIDEITGLAINKGAYFTQSSEPTASQVSVFSEGVYLELMIRVPAGIDRIEAEYNNYEIFYDFSTNEKQTDNVIYWNISSEKGVIENLEEFYHRDINILDIKTRLNQSYISILNTVDFNNTIKKHPFVNNSVYGYQLPTNPIDVRLNYNITDKYTLNEIK